MFWAINFCRDADDAANQIRYWLPRLHSIVIGPGLGRDEKILKNVKVSILSYNYQLEVRSWNGNKFICIQF